MAKLRRALLAHLQSIDPLRFQTSRPLVVAYCVAPVIATPRERAGRVKTAQRRREVLTRPSAPE